MSTETEGPSFWHGREINSCVRCKWLKSRLKKSGRNPDYHFYCTHPVIMTGSHKDSANAAFLEKVKEKLPDRLERITDVLAKEKSMFQLEGEFISNDSYGPETPDWCPVIKEKKGSK